MAGFDPYFGFDTTQKQTLENLLGELGVTVEQAEAVAALATLQNNSAGTADNTVAAMPAAVAAATGADTNTLPTLASVNATLTAIRNNVADLTVKVNTIITALKL